MFGDISDGIDLKVAEDRVAELTAREDSYRVVLKALVGRLCVATGKPSVTLPQKHLVAADERYALRYTTSEDGSVTLWLERAGEGSHNILAPDSKIVLAR